LRAEEELNEISIQDQLSTEHADLTEAIRRLAPGNDSLNKEGRDIDLLPRSTPSAAHFKELSRSFSRRLG